MSTDQESGPEEAPETTENPAPGPGRGVRSLAGRLISGSAGQAERAVRATGLDEALESAIEDAIVRAVESEATERAVTRILNGPAVEQAVEQALRSPAVEQAVIDIIDSDLTERVWEQILESDGTQRLIERIAGSPEIRSAIAAQGIGLIDQIGAGVASVSRPVDNIVERVAWRVTFRQPRSEPTDRVGIATRALALAIDAVVVNIGLVGITAILGMLASFLGLGIDPSSQPLATLGAFSWFALSSVYLFTFWAISGQTPGMRFLDIKILPDGDERIGPRQAFRRLVGFWLSVFPFCLGFIGVLLREDRQGFHDRLGSTSVVYEYRDELGRPTVSPVSPAVNAEHFQPAHDRPAAFPSGSDGREEAAGIGTPAGRDSPRPHPS